MPAVALVAAAACTHARLAEEPLAAISVDPDLQPRLDAQAKAAANARFLHRGRLGYGSFSSDALGLTAEFQEDTGAKVPSVGAELELGRREGLNALAGRDAMERDAPHRTASLAGGIFFLFDPLTTELEAQVTEKLAREVQPDAKGPIRVRGYAIQLSVGVADVNEVELEGTAEMKVAYVPACRGAATLVLMGEWEGAQGDVATDHWFDSVRLDEDAPACAYIAEHAVPANARTGRHSAE